MASDLRVFDFIDKRERALMLPDGLPMGDRNSSARTPDRSASDQLVRLDAAGRRLVDDHLRILMSRHQGRDAA